MTSSLAEVLTYKNTSVVTQFCHHHDQYSQQESEQLFDDLLAWLWLKNEREHNNKPTYLFGPLLLLDKLWHIFILHTRDYLDFSLRYFGVYLHHEPEPVGFEHVLSEEELSDYLRDCFIYLDSSWVERCFADALVDSAI
jgi:hypothetical protein